MPIRSGSSKIESGVPERERNHSSSASFSVSMEAPAELELIQSLAYSYGENDFSIQNHEKRSSRYSPTELHGATS